MSSKKKKGECPKPKEKNRRSPCPYCAQGYKQVGENKDGLPVTVECGYCLGTGLRSIP